MADSKKYNGSTWQHSLRKLGTSTDTLTTLPAEVIADGNNATVGLVGNMSQSGTPTPTTPIQPSECGERTGNLFDYTVATLGKYINASGQEVESSGSGSASKLNHTDYITIQSETNYSIRATSTGTNTCAFCWFDSSKTLLSRQTFNVSSGNYTQTAESPSGAVYMIINYITSNQETVMINEGSTPLPYEPYGYKIPISSANTTTPVYLGEVESTRRIKMYEVTGNENWALSSSGYFYSDNVISDYNNRLFVITIRSTHYKSVVNATNGRSLNDGEMCFYASSSGSAHEVYVKDSSYSSAIDFKTYLQQQYANGTPVTIWYVLATETTGIVNEPLRKIGDYADTISGITIPTIAGADSFDVLTTLKPSEVSLSYTGWHDATVKEWDGSEWD